MSKSGRREIRSERAPDALGQYNQGVVTSAQQLVFVSGQIGIDPASGELVSGGAGCQTEQCVENILAIVRAAGGSNRSIVKTTIYLANIEDFSAVNEAYTAAVDTPYPARSCVGGCGLPKGALVEIEAVAVLEA